MKTKIKSKFSSQDLFEYTIENEKICVKVLNYGGVIRGIYKQGSSKNILLDYEDVDSYFLEKGPYLNALVGPVAGRIAYGVYEYNEKTHQLSTKQEMHHLHGGTTGISWNYFKVKEVGTTRLELNLVTRHDSDGFFGIFEYLVVYELSGNTLNIYFECKPESPTILNMTSHLYFNLSGNMENDILNHKLTIPSDKRIALHPVDRHPYKVRDIEKYSVFDFNGGKMIEDCFKEKDKEVEFAKGLDTPFLLREKELVILEDEKAGNKVSIRTDAPSLIVYSASFFNEKLKLNKGRTGYPYCGIALETQDIPNSINIDGYKTNAIYSSSRPYFQKTSITIE